uniref:Uncharacterized protein n=1 Tax=Anguilla anguilla TaxID=7936 RepID=A0A0E9RAA7_ANGAN
MSVVMMCQAVCECEFYESFSV